MTSCGGPNKPLRIGEVDFDARPDTLPGLVLTGNPMQRGETYGRVFADKIRANICRHLDHPDLPP
jgi:isopenicillin-N N-acyltransferase-like protein